MAICILDSLHLEPLSAGIYTSGEALEKGALARGVFGGQVISQALTAATRELPKDSGLTLNSMHCYFLAAASSTIALRFKVTLLRAGRSFRTYSVSASQEGTKVFALMCSFKLPEIGGTSFAVPCPAVSPPEQCTSRQDVIRRVLEAKPEWSDRMKDHARAVIKETEDSPIETLDCPLPSSPSRSKAYWMRARGVPKGSLPAAVQKTVLAYLSDFFMIGTASQSMGIESPFLAVKGRKLGMLVSLDHTIWFYAPTFDVADWVLHVQDTVVGGDGRAVVQGRVYSRQGELIAATIQEGVIRAKREQDSKL